MPTSNNSQIHSGEFVTLRDYIDTRLRAIEQSTDLTREGLERRLEAMNEIRNALKDQNQTFMTRAEYKPAHDRIVADIQSLRESRALLEGKASQGALNTTLAISIISLIIGLVSLVMRFLGM